MVKKRIAQRKADKDFIDEATRKEMVLAEEERYQKQETDQQKAMYRETLNQQSQMNSMNKLDFGKMTYQEKKLNRVDLHNYKDKNLNEVKAMIPGLNHAPTVGTSPLKRGAIRMMQYADDQSVGGGKKKGQVFFTNRQQRSSSIGKGQQMGGAVQFRTDMTPSRQNPQGMTRSMSQSMDLRQFNKLRNDPNPRQNIHSVMEPQRSSQNPILFPVNARKHYDQVAGQVPKGYVTRNYGPTGNPTV